MRTKAVGWPLLLCLLGGCLCVAMWNDDDAHAWQEPTEAEPADDDNGPTAGPPEDAEFVGVLDCATCHLEVELKYKPRTNFLHFTEFATWITKDKHARSLLRIIPVKSLHDVKNKAFTELLTAVKDDIPAEFGSIVAEEWGESNKLSAEILRKFDPKKYEAIDPKTFEADETVTAAFMNEKRCLSCHANYRTQDEKLDNDVQQFAVGVGCESCHGAASKYRNEHQEIAWRAMSPQDKWTKHGMIDVRSPSARAQQCYGCHVGNPDEGKVVTHEMFAAGHPPLPGIEIETFAAQMPRHWRYLEEKPTDFEQRAEFEKVHTTWKPNDLSSSKAVVLGAVAAQQNFLNLLAAEAANEERAWPQFSMYDCSACHHDLEQNSVRQEAGYGKRRPGRPWIHHWPQALVNAAITHAGVDKSQYETAMDGLTKVLNDNPFGDRAALAADSNVATQAATWLKDNLIKKIEQTAFDASAAKKVLGQLCQSSKSDVIDYNSGRQVVWAIRILFNDVKEDWPKKAEFKTVLEGLEAKLQTQLPARSENSITESLQGFLDRMKAYNANEVYAELQKLAAAAPQ